MAPLLSSKRVKISSPESATLLKKKCFISFLFGDIKFKPLCVPTQTCFFESIKRDRILLFVSDKLLFSSFLKTVNDLSFVL